MAETTTSWKRLEKLRSVFTLENLICAVIILGLLYFIPFPIPRYQTMTGECLRHGETVEFKTKWFEYRYMFRPAVLSGTAWMRIDGGEDRRMALAMGGKYEPQDNWRDLEDSSGHVLLSFLIWQQSENDRRDYEVFTTRSYDAWLMVEDSIFSSDRAPENRHLFLVSKADNLDGAQEKLEPAIDYFLRQDAAQGLTGNA